MLPDIQHEKKTTLPPPQAPPTRLSASELDHLSLPEAAFLVQDLMPEGLVMLAAKPKIGKSWFALNLSIAVASHRRFLNKDVTAGNALYIALEDRHRRFQERQRVVLEGSTPPKGLDIWFESPKIGPSLLEELRTWVRRVPEPRLITIDTMGRAMPKRQSGQGEYEYTTQVLGELQQFALDNGITVLLIHHTRKNDNESADVFDDVLGSTGINGVMDAILVLRRNRHQNTGTLSATGRDIEEVSLDVEYDSARGLWLPHRTTVLSALPSEQRSILQAIADGNTTPQQIGEATGKSSNNVGNQLQKTLQKGLVVKLATGVYTLGPTVAPELHPGESGESGESSNLNHAPDAHLGTQLHW
ncbi:MAG: AAA family ATPase [Trueperaceae bacterium]